MSWERGFNRSIVVLAVAAVAGFALHREAMLFPVDAVWESFERSGDVFALWDSLIGELAVLGSMAMAAGVGLLFLVGWALCGFFSNKRDMQRQGHDGGP